MGRNKGKVLVLLALIFFLPLVNQGLNSTSIEQNSEKLFVLLKQYLDKYNYGVFPERFIAFVKYDNTLYVFSRGLVYQEMNNPNFVNWYGCPTYNMTLLTQYLDFLLIIIAPSLIYGKGYVFTVGKILAHNTTPIDRITFGSDDYVSIGTVFTTDTKLTYLKTRGLFAVRSFEYVVQNFFALRVTRNNRTQFIGLGVFSILPQKISNAKEWINKLYHKEKNPSYVINSSLIYVYKPYPKTDLNMNNQEITFYPLYKIAEITLAGKTINPIVAPPEINETGKNETAEKEASFPYLWVALAIVSVSLIIVLSVIAMRKRKVINLNLLQH